MGSATCRQINRCETTNQNSKCSFKAKKTVKPVVSAKGDYFIHNKLIFYTTTQIWGCIKKFPDWVKTKYIFTTRNTCSEATQRVMAAKLTTLTHKIAIQLHLVAESHNICSSCSRWPVRKLLDTSAYNNKF